METITLDKDINVMFVTAESFPEGVADAHQKLHARVPFSKKRKYLGISRPENGNIVYRAGASESEAGEAEKLRLESLILKKGKYVSTTITDYVKDLASIRAAFKELLSNPEIDPQGYCVEWYFNDKDVRCMVRLNKR